VPELSRILLIRTSALGDVVHCLPVLTALRRHFPEARIGWVVEEAMAPVLAGHPDLDEVFVVRFRPWRHRLLAARTRREIVALRTGLRRFAPQVALDLMGNHKAGLVARLSGALRRLGPARSQRREPSSAVWINEPVTATAVHAVDRALSLVRALGVPDDEPVDFGGDRLFRNATDPRSNPDRRDEPHVLIQPGAGWGNKTYPPEWWGRVASELRRATELGVRVAVAPGEEELARRVVAASDRAATAVPALDLDTLAARLREARLVLGGDTGPTHLAHALGAPVLCLLGPTDPARHGPYGAPDRALSVRLPCSFCYKRFDEPKGCLLSIPPRRVVERALRLLEAPPRSSSGSPSSRGLS
jgi:heptosyltransferase-1